jgi:pyridoxine 5-phosphate synthase
MTVRLHVNVDHVATLRNARGTAYPDPVRAADSCERAGAHGITLHLREDRRHIRDDDVERVRASAKTLVNLEMAATDEMIAIATRIRPDFVTLVPEKREERTTEGGLDVAGQSALVRDAVRRLRDAGMKVSLFIDPDDAQIEASVRAGAEIVELHTGDYANAVGDDVERELRRLASAARHAEDAHPALRVAAGHGLTIANTEPLVARVPEIVELNIGHALVADAVFLGMEGAVRAYLDAIARGEARRGERGRERGGA